MNIIKFFKRITCRHNYKIQNLCNITTLNGHVIIKRIKCSKCGKIKIMEV